MSDAVYRLTLLGQVALEGPREHMGRVAQPRQLALLALLAAHQAPLTRDKLVGTLWPETSQDRARHQLSDALYVLRKELGERAILASADTIGIDHAVVESDLAGFRAAFDEESYAGALDRYGGPFLDGFVHEGSEPFERWILDRRRSLERQAARAAWTLVDRAESAGEIHEAVHWARRSLEIVPDDERGVRRLIRFQGALGNRAGAVRTYQRFADRLEAELEVRPSRETRSLIAAIRDTGSANRASERLDDPTGATESSVEDKAVEVGRRLVRARWGRSIRADWVAALLAVAIVATWFFAPTSEGGSSHGDARTATLAVLPFEARGEGLEVLREGMVDLISTNLVVVSEVRVVPGRTVIARWREATSDGPVDLAGMIEVARSTGARYAVIGSVVGTKDHLRLRGEVYDVRTGTRMEEAVVHGERDAFLTLVDRLSLALLDSLRTGGGAR